ncbi:MAG: YggS family pyridoxal phosphate-dependent enzyme [Fidelibacterota bacterium]
MSISDNVEIVRERIEKAALRSGRDPEDIKIVAISKTFGTELIREVLDCGIKDIGENRVQEAEAKYNELGNIACWHLVGHLQTNKVNKALRVFNFIQSLDSIKLAKKISRRLEVLNKDVTLLFQVNTSEEDTKFGTAVSEVDRFIDELVQLDNLKIEGLMTIAPFTDDESLIRHSFISLREIFERLSSIKLKNFNMKYLSMGMTDDFEIAVEEGSNILRIGRAIFGERKTA